MKNFGLVVIGAHTGVHILDEIEKYLNKDAKKNYKKLQKGDIKDTHSNLQKIIKNLGYKSKTSVKEGVKNFLNWYLEYYKIKRWEK